MTTPEDVAELATSDLTGRESIPTQRKPDASLTQQQESLGGGRFERRYLRVLQVVPLLDDTNTYGGPISVAIEQSLELIARGHSVTLAGGWLGRGAPPPILDGVPTQLFPMRRLVPGPRFAGLVSWPMLAWLRKAQDRFDLAHVHLSRDLNQLATAALLQRSGVPVVSQTHGMICPDSRAASRVLDLLMTRPVLRRCVERLVLTELEGMRLAAVLKAPNTRLSVLGNGVRLRPRVAGRTDALDVLFLARLQPRKGVMLFAEAARLLVGEGVRARFSVVGADWGDLPRLRRFIDDHQLAGHLRYEGAVSREDALNRLAQADVYVLPSVNEPYPMTVLEALGAGTATVVSADTGLSEMLGTADAALVVPADAEAVARALRALLSDQGKRQYLADRGRALIESTLSIARVVDSLERQYLEAANR